MWFSKTAQTNLILESYGNLATNFNTNFKASVLFVQFLSKRDLSVQLNYLLQWIYFVMIIATIYNAVAD